jgi:protein-S-isoprenylcysteine O-methyltransferase Ste14
VSESVAASFLAAAWLAAMFLAAGTLRWKSGWLVVRHPGYGGLALWALSGPLLLRSTAGFVPALAAAGWVVVRTFLEDRVLRVELPGYAEYASRVRYRLVPRIW